MLDAVLAALSISPDGRYIDLTFGRGGHSRAILGRLGEAGRLLAFDRDQAAMAVAQSLAAADSRCECVHAAFDSVGSVVKAAGWAGQVNGILLDLGVSSPQLDEAARGFSFMRDGPLDMRMDQSSGISAAEWLAGVSESELVSVLYRYGEEKQARRIARAIIQANAVDPIVRTGQLARIVESALPRHREKKHPATRTFQAIRLHINDELGQLSRCLAQVFDLLADGGRLVVMSFHSLEDRMVKQFIRERSRGPYPDDVPVPAIDNQSDCVPIGRLARPSPAEVARNPRARSVRLRVAEKRQRKEAV